MTETEVILDRIYRELFLAGQRANRTKRPEIRDVWYAAAALVAKEALALGHKMTEPT